MLGRYYKSSGCFEKLNRNWMESETPETRRKTCTRNLFISKLLFETKPKLLLSFLAGYSAAALLAIIFAIPFAIRVLIHKDSGHWRHFLPAFYSAHLELFLGNVCLGVGVIMLLVLTVERYVSVCHPSYMRPVMGPPT